MARLRGGYGRRARAARSRRGAIRGTRGTLAVVGLLAALGAVGCGDDEPDRTTITEIVTRTESPPATTAETQPTVTGEPETTPPATVSTEGPEGTAVRVCGNASGGLLQDIVAIGMPCPAARAIALEWRRTVAREGGDPTERLSVLQTSCKGTGEVRVRVICRSLTDRAVQVRFFASS